MDRKHTKERIINFRSFLFIGIFIFLSIFCALITLNIKWLGILVLFLLLTLATFLAIFYKNKRKFKFITFILCFIAVLISYFSFINCVNNWSNDVDNSALISGMVESDVVNNGERKIYLSNVEINNIKVEGKFLIYVQEEDYPLDMGTIITFNSKVNSYKLVNGFNVNGYIFRNNLRYYATLETIENGIISGFTEPNMFLKIRQAVREKLCLVMGEKIGSLAYGMLTGDKAYIDSETTNYFSTAGLIHIMAVSGLHLNIISVLLMFVLKKFKIDKVIIAISLSLFLVFYCFIASFSPSILRASIMSLVMIYVFLFSTRADPLSSLCLAFSLILCFAPVFMFEAGFVISICCVYGLIIFKPIIFNALRKIKFPRKLANAISLSLAIQIGISPALIFFFKSFQMYAFIANIIAIPLISFSFNLMLISLIVAFIIPFYAPLKLSGYLLSLIDLIAKTVSKFPYARIIVYSSSIIFACYILFFIMSRFTMLKKKPISVILSISLCFMFLLQQNPVIIKENSITSLDYPYSNISFITTDEGNYIIGDFFNGSGIKNRLIDLRVKNVDGILLNRLNENIAKQIVKFSEFYGDLTIYFPFDNNAIDATLLLMDNKIRVSEITIGSEREIKLTEGFYALTEKSKFYAYSYKNEDTKIIFPPFSKSYDIFDLIDEYNIIRASYYYEIRSNPNTVYLVSGEGDYFNSLVISENNYIFNYKTGLIYKKA